MNRLEQKMIQLLLHLRENYCMEAVRAEFESEGTRLEEAIRLKDLAATAGVGLNIKIGGCEAIRDMFDAVSLGAQRIIAPMVETPYALQKFIRAAQLSLGERLEHIELLVNIETMQAYQNLDAMLKIPEIDLLDGIVFGRVDFVGSMGWGRDQVNSDRVLQICLDVAKKVKAQGLAMVVGGGVAVDSIPFFKQFPKNGLDRFETRKIVFRCPHAISNPEEALIAAVEFELIWLKNKQQYYHAIAQEDSERIKLMETRYQKSLEKLTLSRSL